MLRIGMRAAEFTLPDQDLQKVSLSSLLRNGPLILYFYPADFTPGCTREACSIRDLHPRLRAAGLAVAGVSPQPPETHRTFRDKYQLPFPLLSDTDRFVIRLYDVQGLLGIGVRRATFLIDQSCTIRDALLADFRIRQHEEFVRTAIGARTPGRAVAAPAGTAP
jgi:thioredoxin-dependent peroxiredoxin